MKNNFIAGRRREDTITSIIMFKNKTLEEFTYSVKGTLRKFPNRPYRSFPIAGEGSNWPMILLF